MKIQPISFVGQGCVNALPIEVNVCQEHFAPLLRASLCVGYPVAKRLAIGDGPVRATEKIDSAAAGYKDAQHYFAGDAARYRAAVM